MNSPQLHPGQAIVVGIPAGERPAGAEPVVGAVRPEGMARDGWIFTLPATARIRAEAAERVRIRLELSTWPGDARVAARVAAELADNAARHGGPFLDGSVTLRLTVLDCDALLVRVDDANPRFPEFEAVTDHPRHRSSGLGLVRYYAGQITWHLLLDGERPAGKAVQVVLPSGWEMAA